jgi:hypothetical protein
MGGNKSVAQDFEEAAAAEDVQLAAIPAAPSLGARVEMETSKMLFDKFGAELPPQLIENLARIVRLEVEVPEPPTGVPV